MLTLLLVSILASAFIIHSVKSEPATIIVPDDYPTIQEAIDAAGAADTVFVRNGTYSEGLITISNSIQLIGESNVGTIINGRLELRASDCLIENFTIRDNSHDSAVLTIDGISGCTIHNNIFLNNGYSVEVFRGKNHRVTNNLIVGSGSLGWGVGIYLWGNQFPTYNIASNNIVVNCETGFLLYEWNAGDALIGNIVVNCTTGIKLRSVLNIYDDNTIKENKIIGNKYGIDVSYSGAGSPPNLNYIYHNDVINNTYQTQYSFREGYFLRNVWDDGYPSGGNYWNDYNGSDLDGDGLGDTPYVICTNNIDNYPLMKPWYDDIIAPLIDFASPQNITYSSNTVPLNFVISEPTAWMGCSLDNQKAKTIFGNITLHNLSEGSHHIVLYAIDISGNMGASDEIFFTIHISQPPVSNFTWEPSIPKLGESVTFDASSSTPNGGTLTMYEWDFGDGENATGQIATHVYSNPSTYTVTLNVTDSEGLWDIDQKQIQVVQPYGPKAEFTATPETTNVGESVEFDASGSLSGFNGTHEMPITEYHWDFDNGNKTTTSNPIIYYSFSSSGICYVTLMVYAPGAAPETDSATHKVTVRAVPIGGCSYPIKGYTTTKPLTLYVALVAILTASFTMIRRKTCRRTKQS